MALIWADGFDHYGNNTALALQGIYSGWGCDNNAANARTGAGCAYAYTFDPPTDFNFPVALATGFIGFAFFCDGLGGDNRRYFYGSGGAQFQWHVEGNGAVSLADNSGGIFTSPPAVIQNATWCFVEFGWTMDNPGTLTMRVNGAVVFTSNAVNLGGSATINLMRSRTSGSGFRIDDLYLCDATGTSSNGFLGDIRCRTLFPNADTGTNAWPPTGDGSAHAALAHVPADPATHFVAGANVGDATAVGLDDLPVNTAYVFGAVLVNQLSKTDAGACTVQPALTDGAANENGNAVNPGTGNGIYQSVFQVAPDGSPWSKAKVNGTLAKLTRTA